MNIGVPPRWVRRTLIAPVLLVAFLCLEALLGVVMLVAVMLRPISPRQRVLRVCAVAAMYIALDMRLLLCAFWMWLRVGGRLRDGERWARDHSALLEATLARLHTVAERVLGYEVALVGDTPLPAADRPLIVLARHAGPGDSFTIIELLLRRFGRHPRVVLKSALRWDPGLDVMLTRLSSCFIPSRSGAGEDVAAVIADAARAMTSRDALLIFPEGGNWTPRRQRRAVRRLLRTGHRRAAQRAAAHPNVLPPRPDGTVATLLARPDADVVVITHTGLDTLTSVSSIWRAMPLRNRPMRIRWWHYPAEDIPREDEAVHRWLDQRWAEVSSWVSAQQQGTDRRADQAPVSVQIA